MIDIIKIIYSTVNAIKDGDIATARFYMNQTRLEKSSYGVIIKEELNRAEKIFLFHEGKYRKLEI